MSLFDPVKSHRLIIFSSVHHILQSALVIVFRHFSYKIVLDCSYHLIISLLFKFQQDMMCCYLDTMTPLLRLAQYNHINYKNVFSFFPFLSVTAGSTFWLLWWRTGLGAVFVLFLHSFVWLMSWQKWSMRHKMPFSVTFHLKYQKWLFGLCCTEKKNKKKLSISHDFLMESVQQTDVARQQTRSSPLWQILFDSEAIKKVQQQFDDKDQFE